MQANKHIQLSSDYFIHWKIKDKLVKEDYVCYTFIRILLKGSLIVKLDNVKRIRDGGRVTDAFAIVYQIYDSGSKKREEGPKLVKKRVRKQSKAS
jgi:hypothetical protein